MVQTDEVNAAYYRDLERKLLAEFANMDVKNVGAPCSTATKLITQDDVENYGEELIDLIKRAAKEALAAELEALRQDRQDFIEMTPAASAPNTTPSNLTWGQILETKGSMTEHMTLIWSNFTPVQKIGIAVAVTVVGLLLMFRYEIVPTNRLGVVIQHDRWTGATEMCIVQADRTFKCGK